MVQFTFSVRHASNGPEATDQVSSPPLTLENSSEGPSDSGEEKDTREDHGSQTASTRTDLQDAENDQGLPKNLAQFTLRRRPWRLRTTEFETIATQTYQGSGTEADPYLVQWPDNDVEDPKSYSATMKWTLTMLISTSTLCVSLASSAYTGAFKPLERHFDASDEVLIVGLSVMVLGFGTGGLVWAPLSEAIGRRNVTLLTMAFYTLWTGACLASQNIWTLIIFRFFSGTFGSAAFVLPGGQVADMFDAETRGVAMAAFSAAPFLGPTLGPLIGGYISDAAGWRWVFAFLTLPVLLRQRAKLLSSVTGKVYLTAMDAKRPLVAKDMIRNALVRPWALLFLEPIVLIITIYTGVVYGTLYLCFAAFPIVFQQGRGWSAGKGGLPFLGIMVGVLMGTVVMIVDNKRYLRLAKAHRGFAPPEVRLPPAIFGGIFVVIGMAWFAATNSPNLHWAIPVAAGIPFGVGFILVFMCCVNYLIDSYVIYAASAMAANSTIRSALGAGFPLFTTYMYKNLGIHWASAVPGFLALSMFPFPILFYIYGAKIRKRCKYASEAAIFLESLKSSRKENAAQSTEKTSEENPDEEREAGVV